jgi:hypothetical protein
MKTKQVLFLCLWLFALTCAVSCEDTETGAADLDAPLSSDFEFRVIGEVAEKMRTATEIEVRKKGEPTLFQRLNGFEALVQENEQVIIEDMNFDGIADVRLLQFLPENENIPFFYWLFNPDKKKFERHKGLEKVTAPVFDTAQQLVLSQWTTPDSAQGTDIYTFKSNRLQLIRQEIRTFNDTQHYTLTIKEPLGDSLRIVKQELKKVD